jgi:hypothetical protein
MKFAKVGSRNSYFGQPIPGAPQAWPSGLEWTITFLVCPHIEFTKVGGRSNYIGQPISGSPKLGLHGLVIFGQPSHGVYQGGRKEQLFWPALTWSFWSFQGKRKEQLFWPALTWSFWSFQGKRKEQLFWPALT